MTYDFLIVGSGLFGAVAAFELQKRGKKCLVIERRKHIGGNLFCENIEGINVHKYGAHIFHTSNKAVWDFVNGFVEFNNFVNSPVAVFNDELYNLPFNMNTFCKMWNVKTPSQAKEEISRQQKLYGTKTPKNLEEQALSLVGKDIFEKLVKGYTEKQWGRDCKDLPPFIIKRLPMRFTFDNNYFNDKFQGIPIGGYNPLLEKLLHGTEVLTDTDFKTFYKNNSAIAEKIIYTGAIDEFFDFELGKLMYRTVDFETTVLDTDNFQGVAVVNFCNREVPYTRIIEHKHFEFGTQKKTVISKEFPTEWTEGKEPYYPINDQKNTALFTKYCELAKSRPNVFFGGRLGMYKYFDMDKTIEEAFLLVEKVV